MSSQRIQITCTNPDCGKTFNTRMPAAKGAFSVTCPSCHHLVIFSFDPDTEEIPSKADYQPSEQAEKETVKVSLECPNCGHTFQKKRTKQGAYQVSCPECKEIVKYKITDETSPAIILNKKVKLEVENGNALKVDAEKLKKAQEQADKVKSKLGFHDGHFLAECERCHKICKFPESKIKIGENTLPCYVCKADVKFTYLPPEDELLKCGNCDNGHITKSHNEDGIYVEKCDNPYCQKPYVITIKNRHVVDVKISTETLMPMKQSAMQLVTGSFFNKRKYPLQRGSHIIGRSDDEYPSDFGINDKAVSRQSLRIDVNQQGGNLVYKLTVLKALNPVYHNNSQLHVGDMVFLNYGDTLKIGTTLIRVEKIGK